MTKPDYQEYLKSERWATLREAKRIQAGHRCQICNSSDKLQCHHRSYDNLGEPGEMQDLVVLCGGCHAKFHEKGDRDPGEVTYTNDEWMRLIGNLDVDNATFYEIITEGMLSRMNRLG